MVAWWLLAIVTVSLVTYCEPTDNEMPVTTTSVG